MNIYQLTCPEGCEEGWWQIQLPPRHSAQVEPEWEMQRCSGCDGGQVELLAGQDEEGWWAELVGHEVADGHATLLGLLQTIRDWTHGEAVLAALAGETETP